MLPTLELSNLTGRWTNYLRHSLSSYYSSSFSSSSFYYYLPCSFLCILLYYYYYCCWSYYCYFFVLCICSFYSSLHALCLFTCLLCGNMLHALNLLRSWPRTHQNWSRAKSYAANAKSPYDEVTLDVSSMCNFDTCCFVFTSFFSFFSLVSLR